MTWPFGDLPEREFACIAADPPWSFNAFAPPNKTGGRRDVEVHYPTMSMEEIQALPVGTLAAKDCHLFLWATGPRLRAAFETIEAWGFKYSAIAFTWIKLKRSVDPRQLRFMPTADADLHVGLGFTTRKNAEFCLLARRGNARRVARDVREVILSPVREHSRKPDEAYERIQRYCAGPYAELFARASRPGWATWGLEATKFDEAAA